jgi:DNA-binding XRE family transcriptional regulator
MRLAFSDTLAPVLDRNCAQAPVDPLTADPGDEGGRVRRTDVSEPFEHMPYGAIARQVIRLRACNGVTQVQLAARIGSSHSQISRIESGQHRPSVETLRRIAAAFDADLLVTFEPRTPA